jgi:hypothetical protein
MPWGGHAIERVGKWVTRVRAGYQYDRFRENSETILILRTPLTVSVAEDRCEQTTYGMIELVAKHQRNTNPDHQDARQKIPDLNRKEFDV